MLEMSHFPVGKRENEGKMEKVPMTADGYAALDAEVKKLKGPERQRYQGDCRSARAWRSV